MTEAERLVSQLTGRARFCEDRGEVKTPGLLREAAARIAALEEFVAMCAEMTPEEFLPNGEYERGNLSRAYKAGRFDSIQRKAMKLKLATEALGKGSE